MTTLAFCDTETTGLDPDRHQIWEVALILRKPAAVDIGDGGSSLQGYVETELLWTLPVDLGTADPVALTIGRFYERVAPVFAHRAQREEDGRRMEGGYGIGDFADEFARLTHGAHLIGAVPSFDEERLRKLLRANRACPGWHYQPIDVETLAVGHLMGMYGGSGSAKETVALPWDSDKVSKAIGIDPEQFDRHTALGDARWAKAIYDRIMRP